MSDLSESIIVELFITEPEDIELLQENIKVVHGEILNIKPSPIYNKGYDVQIIIESITQLYLLGRYVGVDRKRNYDLDF